MTVRTSKRPLPTGLTDPSSAASLLAAGTVALVAVVAADLIWSGRPLSDEWPPDGRPLYLVRAIGIAASSAALVLGARRLAVRRLTPAALPTPDRFDHAIIALGTLPAPLSALLLLVDPTTLSSLVREDRIVEWLSAGLAFVASTLFVVAALGVGRHRSQRPPIATAVGLVAASGACLLLGLEEISWFQRVLDIDSPEFMLNQNGQQELNLHNLATGFTGNAYFVGGFVFCAVLPSLLGDRVLPPPLSDLGPLVASRTVLLASASAAGLVYAMWNIVWIQMTFWMTLTALLLVASDPATRRLGHVVLAVTLVTAVVYLGFGDRMVRTWDDTEMRELIIPYGLVVAAVEVALGRHPRGNHDP